MKERVEVPPEEDAAAAFELPGVLAAAHELKAPLSLVRQLALGLQIEGLRECDREVMIEQIILSSERGLRLTSDLTKASRMSQSLFELEPICPYQVCREAVDELEPLFRARGRTLKLSGGQRAPLAVGNRDLVRRVVLSFADNALQYSDEKRPIHIAVGAQRSNMTIRISVRDFGPALNLRTWQQLRRRIGSAPLSMSTRPLSSGLGLYVAGEFARAMYGHVGLVRHRDGTSFYLDLGISRQLSLL